MDTPSPFTFSTPTSSSAAVASTPGSCGSVIEGGVVHHMDFVLRNRFDRRDTARRCKDLLLKLRGGPRVVTKAKSGHSRFITLHFDDADVPDASKVLKLIADLRGVSSAVVVSSGGFLRARYDTRPWKETVIAAAKAFLRRTPLPDLVRFAVAFDDDLEGKSFSAVESKTLETLTDLLKFASLDGESFIPILMDFLVGFEES